MIGIILLIMIGLCLLRLRTVLGEFQTFDPLEEGNVDLVRNLDHESVLLCSIIGGGTAFLSGQVLNEYPAAALGLSTGVIIWIMTIYWQDRNSDLYFRFFLLAAVIEASLICLTEWPSGSPSKAIVILALLANIIIVAGAYELLSRWLRR